MRLSDRVRQFVFENYIRPARQRGEKVVVVRAGDVHKEMEFSDRIPLVCGALGTQLFEREYRVRLVERKGPTHGSNVYFTFEV